MPFFARFYKPLLLFLAVACLVPVSVAQRRLNFHRQQLGLIGGDDPLGKSAPPVLAFTTIALGGFRGLIANFLWIRASDLQDQDKFFEMVQLADWITKLQPHLTTVWVHQAWNMSYNISIKFTDPADRWQWVRRGIELLRDEGLKYNPKEPLLYRELAWHFQHKMGANLDDAHNYFKKVWAQDMTRVFGPGRPHFQELIRPTSPQSTERARLLRDKYKMDPVWVREVDQLYGPLEWRLPESHAIYWAYLGLEKCEKVKLKKDDLIQLRRAIFQSMQLAFHRGKLMFPIKDSDEFIYGPNLEIVAQANKAYQEMMEQEPDKKPNIANGHKNFLKTAVYFLYTHNRRQAAQQWFQYLKELYPTALLASQQLALQQQNPNAPIPDKSLDQFAMERVAEDIGETSHDRVKAILLGLLVNSYMALATDDQEQYLGYQLFARRVYERYQKEIGSLGKERVGMTDFTTLQNEALQQMLDPETGLQTVLQLQLRTALGMPLEASGATNAPPASLTNSPPAHATNAPPPLKRNKDGGFVSEGERWSELLRGRRGLRGER